MHSCTPQSQRAFIATIVTNNCSSVRYGLIQRDARWPAALAQLVALGFQAGDTVSDPEYLWNAMKHSQCVAGTPCVRTQDANGNGGNAIIWRGFLLARAAQYWQGAFEAPARKYFPNVRMSMYSFVRWNPAHCLSPDPIGWQLCTAGRGATSLSIDAPNMYGLSFGNCSSSSSKARTSECNYYGPSVATTLRKRYNITEYNSTVFHGLKLDLTIVKNSMLSGRSGNPYMCPSHTHTQSVCACTYMYLYQLNHYMRLPVCGMYVDVHAGDGSGMAPFQENASSPVVAPWIAWWSAAGRSHYWQEKVLHFGLSGVRFFHYFNVRTLTVLLYTNRKMTT